MWRPAIVGLEYQQHFIYIHLHHLDVADEFVAAFFHQIDAEIGDVPVAHNSISVDLTTPDKCIVVAYDEDIGGMYELPIREIGYEIGLVGRDGHSRSQWLMMKGSSVCMTHAILLSPMLVTGKLEHRKKPESK